MGPGASADEIPNPFSTSAETQPEELFGLETGRGRGGQLPVKLLKICLVDFSVAENMPSRFFRSVSVLLRVYLSMRMLSEFIYW